MEREQHIHALFNRFLENRYTLRDFQELRDFFHTEGDEEIIRALILESLSADNTGREDEVRQIVDNVKRRLADKFADTYVQDRKIKKIGWNTWAKFIAAALVVGLFAAGVIWYFQLIETTIEETHLISRYGDDVLPGRDRATITLADGRVIDLDSAAIGLLAQEQGAAINLDENGIITYESHDKGLDVETSAFNTLTTPRGGQYRIVLADGTKVWLNAGSSLIYPATFTGKQRTVKLEGEAYFEVARNDLQPFVVESGDQGIQVLGTQFNVNAYADQQAKVTTLVEGGIVVYNESSDTAIKIEPNQQATNDGNKFTVLPVDVEDYIAWKDNYFQFSGTELPDAIKQLERWYDLDVDYSTIPEWKIFARISRDKKLSEILYMIEETSGNKFKIEGRRLTIQQ